MTDNLLNTEILNKLEKLKAIAQLEEEEEQESDDLWEKKEQERKLKQLQEREKNEKANEIGDQNDGIEVQQTRDEQYKVEEKVQKEPIPDREEVRIAEANLAQDVKLELEKKKRAKIAAEAQKEAGKRLLEQLLNEDSKDEITFNQEGEEEEEEEEAETQEDRTEEEEEDDDFSVYTYSTDVSHSRKIDEEWDNVVLQLELVVGIVLIPLAGKFFGRRFAHKIWGIVANWIYGTQRK
jgi:hypothetical protein